MTRHILPKDHFANVPKVVRQSLLCKFLGSTWDRFETAKTHIGFCSRVSESLYNVCKNLNPIKGINKHF